MSSRPLALALVFAAALSGCREAQVSYYRIPKEAVRPAGGLPGAPGAPEGDAAVPRLRWSAPDGWAVQPTGSVRVASFLIATPDGRKADMAVTQFPGDVGGDLANVNRWRGQVQLPPLTEAEFSQHVRTVTLPSGAFLVTEMRSETPLIEGTQHAAILGAWLKQPERTWFFKMAGEATLVEAQRAAFNAFLESVAFEATAAATSAAGETGAAADAHAHHDHPHLGRLTWDVPASWSAKPLSQMRKGSYAMKGTDGAEADLSITSFPGEAGGLLDNLNRWRGQLQLAPLAQAAIGEATSTVVNGDFRFTVVDYTSAAGDTRLLGAVLSFDGETVFFKAVGPTAVLEQQKPVFLEFLKSIKTH